MFKSIISYSTRNRVSESVRRLLGAPAPLVQAAALPWRETERGLELMLITSRGTGRWILPKGWPEAGESLWQSAARESYEEAGLKGTISHVEVGKYFFGKVLNTGFERRCEVSVFPIEVDSVDDAWPEKGQRKRIWVEPAKAARMVAEPDLSELILLFCEKPRAHQT